MSSAGKDLTIRDNDENLDGLNYLEGKMLDFVNQQAMRGTVMAHNEGGVPVAIINIPEISPYHFGYMVYFLNFPAGSAHTF